MDGSGESVSFPAAPHSAIGTPALPRYAPRSVTMRGGPPPAWLDRTIKGLMKMFRRPGRATRRPPHFYDPSSWGHVGVIFRYFSHFFAFFSYFFGFLRHHGFFYRFFSNSGRFFLDFSSIFLDFGTIFP